ncbi:RDD family protein [Krasilnikovia cinnamomea]|uniref:RDD family protein n=1 Tax=Krasilnikovia cinnamomea TaxID=349313 RepID=A0A4Q7ZJ99_9ACTN|nr:RDD family protein [Krasilnikovia cinnamomea]RZU50574.1 RDD family protein [Krasilnikovia cinnamomea]
MSPAGQPLADFATRLLAYLIDAAILTGALMVVFMPILILMISRMSDVTATVDPYAGPTEFPDLFSEFFLPVLLVELGLFVLALAAYYVYYVEMMYRSGQTVGKKALKIRVVPLDPAATLTRGMAARRYLVAYVGGTLVPMLGWLDGLWQLWDKPFQQTLHDKAGQTVVVKVPA